jgi:hypothetical protein
LEKEGTIASDTIAEARAIVVEVSREDLTTLSKSSESRLIRSLATIRLGVIDAQAQELTGETAKGSSKRETSLPKWVREMQSQIDKAQHGKPRRRRRGKTGKRGDINNGILGGESD